MATKNTKPNTLAGRREAGVEVRDLTIPVDQLGETSNPVATPPAQGVELNTVDTTPQISALEAGQTATQQEQQDVADLTAQDEALEQDIFSALFDNGSEEEQRFKAEEEAGIGELSKIDKEFFTQQVVQRRKFDRERQAVSEEKGLTLAQKQTRLNNVTRRQNFEAADLALQKFVASNDLANASAAVDRKLNAQFAGQRFKVEQLQFMAERVEGKLGDAIAKVALKEQRAYEQAFREAEKIESIKLEFLRSGGDSGLIKGRNFDNTDELMDVVGNQLGAAARSQLATEALRRSQIKKEIKDAKNQGFELPELASGEQDKIELGFKFTRSAERLKEILAESKKTPLELLTDQSELGKEFRSLKTDITDILARDRTGAVVSKDEAKTFKKILGIGTFRQATSNTDEFNRVIDRSIENGNITMSTVDPTGSWQAFMSNKYPTSAQAQKNRADTASSNLDSKIDGGSSIQSGDDVVKTLDNIEI